MGFEVEIKFAVADPDALIAGLKALDASDLGMSDHADLYLAHPGRDFRSTDEALRLRTVGDRGFVTYKGPKRPGPTKTREEIELPIGSGTLADWHTLFERLGFGPVALVEKTRREFAVGRAGRSLVVTLDDAGRLGRFAEVETLAADEADLSAAQAAVVDLAAELGLTEVEPRSYLRMTLENLKSADSGLFDRPPI